MGLGRANAMVVEKKSKKPVKVSQGDCEGERKERREGRIDGGRRGLRKRENENEME